MELEEKVEKFIRENKLFQPGERVLVGFSGGPDSLCLLWLLKNLPLNLKVFAFHLNHLLRGEEAYRDEKKVRKFCQNHSIPLTVIRRDIKKLRKKGESLEEASRRIRWEEMIKVSKEKNIAKIALGHQLDDQVETVIFRLVKGTGPGGLGGMRARTIVEEGIEIVRPLLNITRKEIENYLSAKGLLPVIDSSNFDLRIPRNRIRHRVIPELEKINPKLREKIYSLTLLLQADEDYFLNKIKEITQRYKEGNKFVLPIKECQLLPSPLRYRLWKFILEEFEKKEVTLSKLKEIEKLLQSSKPNIITNYKNFQIIKEYSRLIFTPTPIRMISYSYTLQTPGEIIIKETGDKIISEIIHGNSFKVSSPKEAYLVVRGLKFPLII